MKAEPLLLHVCCGPCAAGSLPSLLRDGLEVTGFFFNPNIHPVLEHQARMKALEAYSATAGLPMIWRRAYGLVPFVRAVAGREEERCEYCYVTRLRETAREAGRLGTGMFSTTLLYSIHQKHDLIRDIGEDVAREAGVDFLYKDLREGWNEGRRAWRETGLYSQKYCGCIFSEMERFLGREG